MKTIQNIEKSWLQVAPLLSVPSSKEEYQDKLDFLNDLADRIDDDESHPLMSLLISIGESIEKYEIKNNSLPNSSPRDALLYLMEEYGLKQSNLPEIGSQGVVSEILSGKRNLNIRQIQDLSKRFNVSPKVFL